MLFAQHSLIGLLFLYNTKIQHTSALRACDIGYTRVSLEWALGCASWRQQNTKSTEAYVFDVHFLLMSGQKRTTLEVNNSFTRRHI